MAHEIYTPNQNVFNTPPDYTLDLYGRNRVSSPEIMLQLVHNDGNWSNIITTGEVSGSGTSTVPDLNDSYDDLTVGTAIGKRILRSKYAGAYQVNKATIATLAGLFGSITEPNVEMRMGYGHSNGDDMFIKNLNGNISFHILSAFSGSIPIDVPRNSWDDPLDGSGPSQITLDFTKAFMFFITFAWYGLGDVKFGFILNGLPVFAHHVKNLNNLERPFISTANLFPYYSIEKTVAGGNSTYIRAISASVINEGFKENFGRNITLDRGISNSFNCGQSGSVRCLILFRLNPNNINRRFIPKAVEILNTSSSGFYVYIIKNPTFSGTFTRNWVDQSDSGLQYSLDAPNNQTIDNADTNRIWVGTGSGEARNQSNIIGIESTEHLGSTFDDVPEEWALGISCISNNEIVNLALIRLLQET
jgi:hypothetical protein